MFRMTIRARIRALLEHKGYAVTGAVHEALEVFAEALRAQQRSGETDDEVDEDVDLATSHRIACPHCGEPIGIAIDLSGDDQDDIQDCEVCCSPIRITYTVVDGRLGSFSSEPC
jgi:hypothetical protein